eukprot:XP_014002852.1 PREDICTED: SOSS complex subunit C isoform X1 [Salmo salar]
MLKVEYVLRQPNHKEEEEEEEETNISLRLEICAAVTFSDMASPAPGAGFQNKNRVAILAELDKEKRRLIQNSSMNNPGASIPLSRPALNKDFRDHAEQQHIAAQQKAALQHAHAHSSGFFITQDSSFGNLILPVLPRLDPPPPAES